MQKGACHPVIAFLQRVWFKVGIKAWTMLKYNYKRNSNFTSGLQGTASEAAGSWWVMAAGKRRERGNAWWQHSLVLLLPCWDGGWRTDFRERKRGEEFPFVLKFVTLNERWSFHFLWWLPPGFIQPFISHLPACPASLYSWDPNKLRKM